MSGSNSKSINFQRGAFLLEKLMDSNYESFKRCHCLQNVL